MELELADVSLPSDARERADHASRAGDARRASRSTLAARAGRDRDQADERKVRQVVFNLLSNAVKFTPEGGRVDVARAC